MPVWIGTGEGESEMKVKVTQSCPTVCDSMGSPWNSPGQNTGGGRLFSGGSSQPRNQTQVSRIVGRFFTSWAERKPKNTEVGSLSLLQGIFPTQGSNRGLLHCRQILYQLSYQEEWRIGSKEENKIKWNKQHKIGVRLKTDKQMGELRES